MPEQHYDQVLEGLPEASLESDDQASVVQPTTSLPQSAGNIAVDDGTSEFLKAMTYLKNKAPSLALEHLTRAVEKKHRPAAEQLGIFLENSAGRYAEEKLALANFYSSISSEPAHNKTQANTWYLRAAEAGSLDALLELMPLVLHQLHEGDLSTYEEVLRLCSKFGLGTMPGQPNKSNIALNIAYQFKNNNFSQASIAFFEQADDLNAKDKLAMAQEYLKYEYEKNQLEQDGKADELVTTDIASIGKIRCRQYRIDKTLPYFIDALRKAISEKNDELKLTIDQHIHKMLEQLTKHHYVLSYMTYQKIFFNQKLLPEAATINLLLEKMSFFIDADNISLFPTLDSVLKRPQTLIESPYLLNIFLESELDYSGLIQTCNQIEGELNIKKDSVENIYLAFCILQNDVTLEQIKSLPNYLLKILINLLSDKDTESLERFKYVMSFKYLQFDFFQNNDGKNKTVLDKIKKQARGLEEKITTQALLPACKENRGYCSEQDFDRFNEKLYSQVKLIVRDFLNTNHMGIYPLVIPILFFINNEIFNILKSDREFMAKLSIVLSTAIQVTYEYAFLLEKLLPYPIVWFSARKLNIVNLLKAVITLKNLALVKIVVEQLGTNRSPQKDPDVLPLALLTDTYIARYLIEQGAIIDQDLFAKLSRDYTNNPLTMDCKKTLLYYSAHRNQTLPNIFKDLLASNLYIKRDNGACISPEEIEIMLESFLMTGMLDTQTLSLIEKQFVIAKAQKTKLVEIGKLLKLVNATPVSFPAIEKFLTTLTEANNKDFYISYIVHRLLLKSDQKRLPFSHQLIQKVTDPQFKAILSNKLFFCALILDRMPLSTFAIIRDVIYNRSRDSWDIELTEAYPLVKEAIFRVSKNNLELNSYLSKHFLDKYSDYSLKANKFKQLLPLWHEAIKDNQLSVEEMLQYIDKHKANLSIPAVVCALLNYRIALLKQKQEVLENESDLTRAVLTTYKSILQNIMPESGVEIDCNVNIDSIPEMQNFKTLLLKHEWKTHKGSNKLARHIYLNEDREQAVPYLTQSIIKSETNWLNIFIKQSNEQDWQAYIDETPAEELWQDFQQSCGKPSERMFEFEKNINWSFTLNSDDYYYKVFKKVFPFEIIYLFTDNTKPEGITCLKTAQNDLIHLLHTLANLKDKSISDIDKKLYAYLVTQTQYRDVKSNRDSTLFVNNPSDYYSGLRKCLLELEPRMELPTLAAGFIETVFNLRDTCPGAKQFCAQYESAYPPVKLEVKDGLSPEVMEEQTDNMFAL